ncbi:MAG: ATP-binding protein [Woeseia sp.]
MKMISFPIRVKVLLTVVLLVMLVMSLNTSTMAGLFRQDKTTYIRDLTSVMAIHVAEEADVLLRQYVANMRTFGDLVYDENLDPDTKQKVLRNLFRNYQDIVALVAQRDGADPVTVFDVNALTRLDLSRDAYLQFRRDKPVPAISGDKISIVMERVSQDVELARLSINIPASDSGSGYTMTASIEPQRLRAITGRSRGFNAMLRDRQGRPLFAEPDGDGTAAQHWPNLLSRSAETAMGTAIEFVANGVPMIGAYAPLAGGALWASIEIPSSVIYLTARELLSNLTIIALLLFAFAAAASLVFARRLSRPLEDLTEAAKKVGKGEFQVTVKSVARDEIGELSRSFNQMTHELSARELKLSQANAALVQSEKLAAFGQLGAGIAHEVKNPLAGILGYTQLTLRKLDEDSPFRKNLNIIETETRRCTEIISNLLQFARQESSAAEPTDINAVVDAALQIVDHQLGVNNVSIHRELDASLPMFEANANQLQQVIMNFAINAQQAMGPDGGDLYVRTRAAGGDGIVIEVEDNGPGIPEQIRAKIFDPFFTTKPAGQGTGLGLSVTYGIIKDHGGDIRVEPVASGGTRFVVTLPTSAAKAA